MSRAGLEVAGSFAPRLRARLPACDGSLAGRRTPVTFPPRQTRRCRRRFRTTATVRTRTPSLGSTRTLRPERTRLRSLFTCSASSRTRSLAASLGLPRQRPTGRFELSGFFTFAARLAPRALVKHRKDASHRLLQPTPVTSTLRFARFPVAPRSAPRLAAYRVPERRPILGVRRGGEVLGTRRPLTG
jgi:hypothetical protein